MERSRADVALLNQRRCFVSQRANSTITVEAPKEERTGVVELARGCGITFFSRGPEELEVKTPFTIAGVRGTEFLCRCRTRSNADYGLRGNRAGRERERQPERGLTASRPVASAGKAPALRVVVASARRRAVGTSLLSAGRVFPTRRIRGARLAGECAKLHRSLPLKAISARPSKAALERPGRRQGRAILRLPTRAAAAAQPWVARDEARADIDRSLQIVPNDPNALSLLAIIDVTQNEKDKAFDTAQSCCVAAAPDSATGAHRAFLARSRRASRSRSRRPRASVEKARWRLRSSECAGLGRGWPSSNRVGLASSTSRWSLRRRPSLSEPNLSRTQTALGFAFLTEVKTVRRPAKPSTRRSRASIRRPTPSAPTRSRPVEDQGMADSRTEAAHLEIAASLIPITRLSGATRVRPAGEEKRSPLDEREYATAKQLDPKDPTPYFYDAIAKQTTNRPVEALQDIEKAIEFSTTTGPFYRSKLLLILTLAARECKLGARIHRSRLPVS